MGTMQFAESRQDGAAILAERALHPLDAPPGARRALRGAEASLPDARAWNDLLGAPVLGAQELSALNAIARPRFVPQGGVVFDKLLRQGVIVRPVAGYGMPDHLRVTIGLPEENERFLAALKSALGR